MNDYKAMTPAARWEAIEQMGPKVFGKAWKGKLAECYGMRNATVSGWRNQGAPIWAAVALADRLAAINLRKALIDSYCDPKAQ